MHLSSQLSLYLEPLETTSWETFYPGQNRQAMTHVQQLVEGHGENYIYLYGEPGIGKSHLLQAACYEARQRQKSALYVSLKGMAGFGETLLDNLETLYLVCLDDIEAVVGNPIWEEKLFHFFNALINNGGHLLMASLYKPTKLKIGLPDLASRLKSGLSLKLQRLEDEELLAALQLQAMHQGLVLPEETALFLLRRSKRNMRHLQNAFLQLKAAALAEQRKLTVPFVKQVLHL